MENTNYNISPLLIIGMHRSFSSLTTNWLAKCGLNIGNKLDNNTYGNIKGHFEDLDFKSWHERMLNKNELSNKGYVNSVPNLNFNKKDIDDILNIIHFKNAKNHSWGWKDPRTCIFLNLYKQLIPKGKYLILFRSHDETVTSLFSRDLANITKCLYTKNLYLLLKGLYRYIVFRYIKKNKWLILYSNTWVVYYTIILKEIISENSFLVINRDTLINKNKELFHLINNLVSLNNYVSIKKIVVQKSNFKKRKIKLTCIKERTKINSIEKQYNSLIALI